MEQMFVDMRKAMEEKLIVKEQQIDTKLIKKRKVKKLILKTVLQ